MASLAANVAVAEPTATRRVIAALPSFALIVAYEVLMHQVRRSAAASGKPQHRKRGLQIFRQEATDRNAQRPRQHTERPIL